MLKNKALSKSKISNQKGMAMIEALPLLVIFVMLLSFGMGLYGAVHTATLHSISARTYAFETFRQRTNLTYFREDGSGLSSPFQYRTKGFRYHGVSHETDQRPLFVSTIRPIALGRGVASTESDLGTHNQKVYDLRPRNQVVEVNPIWIMVGYGICLDRGCGQ